MSESKLEIEILDVFKYEYNSGVSDCAVDTTNNIYAVLFCKYGCWVEFYSYDVEDKVPINFKKIFTLGTNYHTKKADYEPGVLESAYGIAFYPEKNLFFVGNGGGSRGVHGIRSYKYAYANGKLTVKIANHYQEELNHCFLDIDTKKGFLFTGEPYHTTRFVKVKVDGDKVTLDSLSKVSSEGGDEDGKIDEVGGVAVDQDNLIVFVSDRKYEKQIVNAYKYATTPTGRIKSTTWLGHWGEKGVGGKSVDQLNYPNGVACCPARRLLFITDESNYRVQVLQYAEADGKITFEHVAQIGNGERGSSDGQFSSVSRVRVDQKNEVLYIVDGDERVMYYKF